MTSCCLNRSLVLECSDKLSELGEISFQGIKLPPLAGPFPSPSTEIPGGHPISLGPLFQWSDSQFEMHGLLTSFLPVMISEQNVSHLGYLGYYIMRNS